MTTESAAPSGADSAPLSVDQAVGLLTTDAGETPQRDQDQAAPGGAADEEIPADPEAEAAEGAQDDSPAPEAGEDDGEPEPDEVPAIEPPGVVGRQGQGAFRPAARRAADPARGLPAAAGRPGRPGTAARGRDRPARRGGASPSSASTRLIWTSSCPGPSRCFAGDGRGSTGPLGPRKTPRGLPGREAGDEGRARRAAAAAAAQQQTQQQAYARFLAPRRQKLPQLAPDLADPERSRAPQGDSATS
jgi:hypothetical protein